MAGVRECKYLLEHVARFYDKKYLSSSFKEW